MPRHPDPPRSAAAPSEGKAPLWGHRRLRNAWAERHAPARSPRVCPDCQERRWMGWTREQPRPLGFPIMVTVLFLVGGLGTWERYRDLGAALAALASLFATALIWREWSAPCAQCQARLLRPTRR